MKETNPTKNIFKEILKKDPGLIEGLQVWEGGVRKKGLRCGTLANLVTPILANMDIPIGYKPEWKHVRNCFCSQMPGFVRMPSRGFYIVNWKIFTRWVKANVRRIFLKKKDSNKPVQISDLPKKSQEKVRKIKGRLSRGNYNLTTIIEDKTVDGTLQAVLSQ